MWQGDGTGTFVPQTPFDVGDLPGAVAVRDFDGDGHLDFAVTTSTPGYRGLAVVYGWGGGFQAPVYDAFDNLAPALVVDSFRGDGIPDVAVINNDGVSVLLNVQHGSGSPGGPSGQAQRPLAEIERFSENAFSRIAGAEAALRASLSSPATPTSVIPSARSLPPVLDVAGVERFFTSATEQGPGSAWLRLQSKRDALRVADDWWVDGPGKEGWLVERTILALQSQ